MDPAIGGRVPKVIELEPGAYSWCACGRSKKQPFCDGSHAGTGFVPLRFEVAEARRVALCTCKRTGNSPFCDGTHSRLPT
jgi:CDGSH-type Zn-finger protein